MKKLKTRWQPDPTELADEINRVRAHYDKKCKSLSVRGIAQQTGLNRQTVHDALSGGTISDETFDALWDWWCVGMLHYPAALDIVK